MVGVDPFSLWFVELVDAPPRHYFLVDSAILLVYTSWQDAYLSR